MCLIVKGTMDRTIMWRIKNEGVDVFAATANRILISLAVPARTPITYSLDLMQACTYRVLNTDISPHLSHDASHSSGTHIMPIIYQLLICITVYIIIVIKNVCVSAS